ncbi:AfsR family transcriptional regulator, partial [Streptomyces sp. SID7760]|nr:AfsR family transcriptional regulator [Streptomyces sp. SID7760]
IGDRRIERLATQHLARHQADAGHWHQALITATRALDFDYCPGATDIPHILLLVTKGEALLELGHRTEGVTQLDLAAQEAEAAGYDDGAVRALAVLIRAAPDTAVQARYDTALARLITRTTMA